MITGDGSQLSVAVADPVFAGNCEAWQFIVKLAGQVITGAVISRTVIVWLHVLKFPQLSDARQVRVITLLPEQLPATVASVYEITGDASQLSVAVAVPVLAGSVDAWQLMVVFAGQVKTGAVTS